MKTKKNKVNRFKIVGKLYNGFGFTHYTNDVNVKDIMLTEMRKDPKYYYVRCYEYNYDLNCYEEL